MIRVEILPSWADEVVLR